MNVQQVFYTNHVKSISEIIQELSFANEDVQVLDKNQDVQVLDKNQAVSLQITRFKVLLQKQVTGIFIMYMRRATKKYDRVDGKKRKAEAS